MNHKCIHLRKIDSMPSSGALRKHSMFVRVSLSTCALALNIHVHMPDHIQCIAYGWYISMHIYSVHICIPAHTNVHICDHACTSDNYYHLICIYSSMHKYLANVYHTPQVCVFSHFISYLLISYYTYLHIFCSLCEIYHMNVHKYVYHKPCLNGWPILYTSSNTPTYVSLLLKYITYTTPTHSLHLFHTSHRHVLCE